MRSREIEEELRDELIDAQRLYEGVAAYAEQLRVRRNDLVTRALMERVSMARLAKITGLSVTRIVQLKRDAGVVVRQPEVQFDLPREDGP